MNEWLNWTEWPSGFLYFFQFKPEFCNKELMIWATVSSMPCFCWLYRTPIFICKAHNKSDLGTHHLVMSVYRIVSWVVGKGCLLWPACSLDKTLLAFALLRFSLQGQTGLFFQVSLDFLLLHYSLLWWKELLVFLLILEGVIGLYKTGNNFSCFGISCWVIDLNYCLVEWFAS